MAIQSDETLVTKGDLKELYQDKILPYLGGNMMMATNVSDYYNTDEKVVGVWIDGKPIYQRTYDFGSAIEISSTVWYNTGFSYGDADIVIKVFGQSGLGSSTTTNAAVPLICYAESPTPHNWYIMVARDNSSIRLRYFTVQYTKTTDAANSAAATPGCYDPNRPDLWPANKEIFFGNGLYGKRFMGTFTSPTSFNTNIAQLDTIDRGTTFKFINRGGNIFRRNDTAMPLGVQDTLQYDIWYANSSSSQDVGLRLRGKDNGAYSCSYDIWVTYTK